MRTSACFNLQSCDSTEKFCVVSTPRRNVAVFAYERWCHSTWVLGEGGSRRESQAFQRSNISSWGELVMTKLFCISGCEWVKQHFCLKSLFFNSTLLSLMMHNSIFHRMSSAQATWCLHVRWERQTPQPCLLLHTAVLLSLQGAKQDSERTTTSGTTSVQLVHENS